MSLSDQKWYQCLVLIIKFELAREKSEFWKPCIHYLEADNFPRLKEFSNEIGSNVSKCDFFDTV